MKHRITWSILTGWVLCEMFGFSAMSFAGKWEPKAPLLTDPGRWGLATSVVDGKIYAIGGRDMIHFAGGNDTKVTEYDPEQDKWIEKKEMPTGRLRIAASTVRGKIYVFGGTDNNFEALPTVEAYDPATDTWEQKADMPTARMGIATAVIAGKIYIIGGATDFFFPTGVVEVYSPATDTWERKADMPTPRWGIGAVAARSKIYVFGGAVDNTHANTTKTVEMYDIVADTWTPKANMPLPYLNMGVTVKKCDDVKSNIATC